MALPSWLPSMTRRLIEHTVTALKTTLDADLEAAALVGAAMNPARADRGRAPEIIALAAGPRLNDLAPIARGLHDVMRAGARVRLLSRRELERSCDVFALEIAEWRARHHPLYGADVFGALRWSPADMRRSLETELRGLSRRVRNRVLAGVATDGERDDPGQAVADGIDRLVIVAHHALELVGVEPPPEEPALLQALGARAGADVEPLQKHLAIVRAGDAKLDPIPALAALLTVIEPSIEMIDAWHPET